MQTALTSTHRLAPLRDLPAGCLLVHEIYRSIQGESTFCGLPCVFVRLTTCHLRCRWCDTPHAFNAGEPLSLEATLARVLAETCPLVEITGGEPLLQENVYPLMTRLAEAGCTVLLETSGAVRLDRVDRRVHVIMDLKCPGSGEVAENCWDNLKLLKPIDEIKFVIADRADFDWALQQVRAHDLSTRHAVLISPVFNEVSPQALAEWVLESELPLRMQLQLHKYVWAPDARGV